MRKDNDRIQKELYELKAEHAEREKKPETKEPPKRELKKDHRRIPGGVIHFTLYLRLTGHYVFAKFKINYTRVVLQCSYLFKKWYLKKRVSSILTIYDGLTETDGWIGRWRMA